MVVGIVCYGLGVSKNGFESMPEDVEVESVDNVGDGLQKLPSCDVGRCPDYQSADVDGDGLAESVVYQPYGMTKGAASVWVIKNDEVVFRSDIGAMLNFKFNEESDGEYNGLVIVSVDEFGESGIDPKTWKEKKWVYEDGEYVLFETKAYENKPL